MMLAFLKPLLLKVRSLPRLCQRFSIPFWNSAWQAYICNDPFSLRLWIQARKDFLHITQDTIVNILDESSSYNIITDKGSDQVTRRTEKSGPKALAYQGIFLRSVSRTKRYGELRSCSTVQTEGFPLVAATMAHQIAVSPALPKKIKGISTK